MPVTRGDANLIDLLWVLLRFDLNGQHRGFDNTALQATLAPADGLDGVYQHVAPLGFVLVLGEAWASGKPGRVFFIGRFGLTKRFPRISELLEHLL